MNNSTKDWAYLERYRLENELLKLNSDENRIVFIGDSIIAGWNDDALFIENPHFINRGINGQTSSQILHRFQNDVIDLKPKKVVILVGTNDIAENQGPVALEKIEDNFLTMLAVAKEHNVKIILCSILPSSAYYWNKSIQPLARIKDLNSFLASLADEKRVCYVDFHTALEENTSMNPRFSEDGVHPNLEGYKIMSAIISKSNYL